MDSFSQLVTLVFLFITIPGLAHILLKRKTPLAYAIGREKVLCLAYVGYVISSLLIATIWLPTRLIFDFGLIFAPLSIVSVVVALYPPILIYQKRLTVGIMSWFLFSLYFTYYVY